jgi:opacity protein-like surface antigen
MWYGFPAVLRRCLSQKTKSNDSALPARPFPCPAPDRSARRLGDHHFLGWYFQMKNNKWSVNCFMLWILIALSTLLTPVPGWAASWYVRGAVGYEKSLASDFSDTDCSSANPPALFGCVKGVNGQPIGAYGDFGHFPTMEAAVGRQLLPWLRTDVSFAYRFRMDYEGNANFLAPKLHPSPNQPVSAKADSFSGLINFFIDINGFFSKKKFWRVQPYVGGGVGLAYNRLDPVTYQFPDNTTHKISITPSGNRKDFAFMLAVGTGVILTDRLSLDIAYRYFDLGRVETASGNMYMNHAPSGIDINSTEAPLRTHGLSAGLRYQF